MFGYGAIHTPKREFPHSAPSRTEPIFSLPTPEHSKKASGNNHFPITPHHTPIFH